MTETQSPGDILTIRQLAEYLMVSEKTVYRMLDRNQLPGMRVGAQWRFRRQDIDGWINEEVRKVEYEGHQGLLDSLEPSNLAVHPLLTPENVWLGLKPGSRDELVAHMAREAVLEENVDRDQLCRSILEREAMCSTALLERVAFPHPADPVPFRFSRKRALLAVLREPLDFVDPHGHRPRVVVMILARSMQGHLLALSRAIKLFTAPALVDRLTDANDAADAIEAIRVEEERLEAVATREDAP
jgi:excisionase family DNA binding protein